MNVRSTLVRCVAAVLLPTLAVAWMQSSNSFAADEKPAASKKKQPADYRGPLPAYYGKVMSPDTKERAYEVYEKFEKKIKDLESQIQALEDERIKEIEAMLSPDQIKRVAELKAEAAKKRDAAKSADAN